MSTMSSTNRVKYILLTGEPGVGKTTVTKKLCSTLTARGVSVDGFYTEERRGADGGREGFDVVSLQGERGKLARDVAQLESKCAARCRRVGKYAVMVEEFEGVAIPALSKEAPALRPGLLVIDEIGKMELLSEKFRACMKRVLAAPRATLATVPLRCSDPLLRELTSHPASMLFQITRENRNVIHEVILKHLEIALQL